MGEEFTVTRGAQPRTGRPIITLVLVGLLVAYLAVQAVALLWRGLQGMSGAPAREVVTFMVSWLLLIVLIHSLVRMLKPFWQLVRATGTPADVVLAVDDSGLRMADGGCRISAPWSSIAALDVRDRTSSGFRLRVVASGPVDVSRDPLGRVMGKRLRRGGVHLRFTPDNPNERELVDAIARHSRGRFAVSA